MRGHVPSNEVTAAGYAPVYHDTKRRLESVFGARSPQMWPAGEQTCSNCYSVAPAVPDFPASGQASGQAG